MSVLIIRVLGDSDLLALATLDWSLDLEGGAVGWLVEWILEARLSAQRIIFRNTAINLLAAITRDRLGVENIANKRSSSPARQELSLAPEYHNRIDALSESFVACHQTADQIRTHLHTLCAQLESFRAEVGEKDDVRSTYPTEPLLSRKLTSKQTLSTSGWLKNVKTRFKLGFNKPQIGKAVESRLCDR